VGWGVKRQGCQGYCKKPIPTRNTAQRHVTGTKLIHTTDSRSSEHFSLTFGRYVGRIPVSAPVIPRTCAFAQSAATSSLIASLVRTCHSSFFAGLRSITLTDGANVEKILWSCCVSSHAIIQFRNNFLPVSYTRNCKDIRYFIWV